MEFELIYYDFAVQHSQVSIATLPWRHTYMHTHIFLRHGDTHTCTHIHSYAMHTCTHLFVHPLWTEDFICVHVYMSPGPMNICLCMYVCLYGVACACIFSP